jgi:hypothetical protein
LWTPHVPLLIHLRVHSPYKQLPCYTTSHKLTTCYILFKKVTRIYMHDATCEEFLHTFHMKTCTHKTHLGMELLCSCSLTNKGGSM